MTYVAFMPQKGTERVGRGQETSVNWCDSPESGGGCARKFGLAVVDTFRLKQLVEDGKLHSIERAPLHDNPFHGNIVYPADSDNGYHRTVASSIALYARLA